MGSYQQISQEEAKERMDAGGVVILDVREQSEYDAGHIPGAAAAGENRPGERRRGHPRKGRRRPGLLPQRQAQQTGGRGAG